MRYALSGLLFFSIPSSADNHLEKPLNLTKAMAAQYLASFNIDEQEKKCEMVSP